MELFGDPRRLIGNLKWSREGVKASAEALRLGLNLGLEKNL